MAEEAIKTYHPWDVVAETACKKKAREAVRKTITDFIKTTQDEQEAE